MILFIKKDDLASGKDAKVFGAKGSDKCDENGEPDTNYRLW